MMTQTLALLLDAYRELNAKKMFWIVLILNVLVVAVFAILGVGSHSLTLFWKELGDMRDMHIEPAFAYKYIFSWLVVGLWFTFLSTILALISTAGIFPDFVSSGAIDLYLAKPIGRLRLFLTKYLSGLLFVGLQVAIFTVMSFLVLGIRGGIWEPGLFLAIPIVLLFFSYLYSVCVLLGTLTRSTIAALLLTLLAWFGFWAVDYVDRWVASVPVMVRTQHERLDAQIHRLDREIEEAKSDKETRDTLELQRKSFVTQRDEMISPVWLDRTQTAMTVVKSFVPKTRDTIVLLDRVLFRDKELQEMSRQGDDEEEDSSMTTTLPSTGPGSASAGGRVTVRRSRGMSGDFPTSQIELDRRHSAWWIVGTSLMFEAAMMALAAWVFCRRDY